MDCFLSVIHCTSQARHMHHTFWFVFFAALQVTDHTTHSFVERDNVIFQFS